MDVFFLLMLLCLVFIGIPLSVGYLLYAIARRFGNLKVAKITLSIYISALAIVILLAVFEDELFTKNEARIFVEAQHFKLSDDFKILNNETMIAIGDYYHTFTLEISQRDKENAIKRIKSSKYFSLDAISIDASYSSMDDRYFGLKTIRDYETEYEFVNEYFEPGAKQGYTPTHRKIRISKTKNELIFEDIDD